MGLPTFGDGNGGDGLGGGGDVYSLRPEHSHIVHFNQRHHGYVYGGGVAPWVTGVPEVAISVELGLGPGRDEGSGTD